MVTLLRKLKLLRGFLSGENAYTGPLSAVVDITRRCNLACLGCQFHSERLGRPMASDSGVQDMRYELFSDLCEDLWGRGTRKLYFIGEGEPFLHARVLDFIRRAKSIGFHLEVFTNGTALTGEKIQTLVDLRLDQLSVSIWTALAEEYPASYSGVNPELLSRAKEMLQVLRRLKTASGSRFPRVVLHQPLHRHNFRGVRALVQLALSAGCDGVCLSPFVNWDGALPSYGLLPEQEDSLRRDLLQLKGELRPLPLTQNIDELLLRYKIGEAVWQKQPCYIGWVQARIKMDGTVVPCGACALSLGNLRQKSFLEIWHGPVYRAFRRNSITREGLQALSPTCDCRFCCFTDQNRRAHLIFKWFSAFAARS